MNIYDVYKNLIDLYNRNENENEFFDNVSNGLRISVTHNQAVVHSLVDKKIVLLLLDVNAYANDIEHKIMFSDKHGTQTTIVEIANHYKLDFKFIGNIPKYLPPGKNIDSEIWNLNDISEEFIFQKSTIDNIPEYKYFEQLKRYHSQICKLNVHSGFSVLIELETNWDDLPLCNEDFQ